MDILCTVFLFQKKSKFLLLLLFVLFLFLLNNDWEYGNVIIRDLRNKRQENQKNAAKLKKIQIRAKKCCIRKKIRHRKCDRIEFSKVSTDDESMTIVLIPMIQMVNGKMLRKRVRKRR